MFIKFGILDSVVVINTDSIQYITKSKRKNHYYTIYCSGGFTHDIYFQDFNKLIGLLKCKSIEE